MSIPLSQEETTEKVTTQVQSRLLRLRSMWRDYAKRFASISALIVLVALMGSTSPSFLTVRNFMNVLDDTATLLVLSLGETFVILIGGIDLSIQAIAAMTSIVTAILIPRMGYLAFIVATLVGTFAGFLNGIVHTKARMPTFIVTLGSMGLWTGIAFATSKATPIQILRTDHGYLTWVKGTTLGVPNGAIVALLVLLICFVFQNLTKFGRYVYAIGAGEQATKVAGVRIPLYKTLAFTLCGTFAGLAGVMLAGRVGSGSPRLADGFLLMAIASVIVGGTAITGGAGGVFNTLVGTFIISITRIGMTIVGVNILAQQIVYGLIVILAVAMTTDRSKIPIIK